MNSSRQHDDGRVESLIKFGEQLVVPLMPHLVRLDQLEAWCNYIIDSWLQQQFPWEKPLQEHLWWWHGINNELQQEEWLQNSLNRHNLGWQMAVSSAHLSAAQQWFSTELEELFVCQLARHEKAICTVIDCGESRGLALEISVLAETGVLSLDDLPGSARYSSEHEVSLEDMSSGIPQLLGSSPPGSWLPPFYNGQAWIILHLDRIHRPSLTNLKPILLRKAIQDWQEITCKLLVNHWLNTFGASTLHA